MSHWLFTHGSLIASYSLKGGLVVLFLCESLAPRRPLRLARVPRWWQQLALYALGSALLRVCVPVSALVLAFHAEQRSWGLLHLGTLPSWLAIAAGVMAMDLGNYGLHRLSHVIPLLWRIHQVHHSDLEFDCGTAIRHHPLEALFSQAGYLVIIVGLGVAPLALLLYASFALCHDLFTHSNLAVPAPLDRALRVLIVTPDMHRIHHSADYAESNRNFASLFSWWDRLLGTYTHAPVLGQCGMALGLSGYRHPEGLTLWKLLRLPFIQAPAPEGVAGSVRTTG